MTEEIIKRFEEAAIKLQREVTPHKDWGDISYGFVFGAKYGYKEAIEQAKKWWKQGSVWLDLMSVKDSNDLGDLINTFESDMNKL